MSERSAEGTGGKKRAFRASHLASCVVAGPWGVVRVGMEGGVGGRKLFDLAHLANLQKLFPLSLDAFSIASSKLRLFALLIAALMALLASRYSCQVCSEGFLLCCLKALLASSTSSPICADHQGTQKGAGFDIRTYSAITPFIQEIKESIERSISGVEENLRGNEFISFALSIVASLLAFFHSGRGSNTQ